VWFRRSQHLSDRVPCVYPTFSHGRFRDALAAAANRAFQYGADAMLVLGHEHHGEDAEADPVGNAFMAAPIRADEAKVLSIEWT
jgi:hypothetical protein